MTDNPLSDEFWSAEEAAFWEIMAPVILELLLAGGESGIAQLPADIQILMNWDVFNQAAVDYLSGYRFTWIKGINATTRTQTARIIQEWIRSGESLDILKAKLAPIFGEVRATKIAVTEVTRAYTNGNLTAWNASGMVSGKRWNTARDDRVTPLCRALEGQVVGLNDFFVVPPEKIAADPELAKMVAQFGDRFQGPPAHVLCRSGISPIVSEDLVRKSIREALYAP